MPQAASPQAAEPKPDDTIEENGAGAETGRASWYDLDCKTASGEALGDGELTAAHPSWPFGTRLRVVNLKNGREVVVRVNDRGPFAKDRIIDLSKAAATAARHDRGRRRRCQRHACRRSTRGRRQWRGRRLALSCSAASLAPRSPLGESTRISYARVEMTRQAPPHPSCHATCAHFDALSLTRLSAGSPLPKGRGKIATKKEPGTRPGPRMQ